LRFQRNNRRQGESQSPLDMMGICDEMDEKYMDAITAVSGSGPGYMSIVVEALTLRRVESWTAKKYCIKSCSSNRHGTGKLIIDLNEDPAKN